MYKVRKLTSTTLSFLVFAFFPMIAQALGLGAVRLHSHLNEPLNAEIGLDSVKEDQLGDIKVSIANQDIYAQSGFITVNWLQTIQFKVKKNPKTAESIIEMTTKEPIKDPFVDLLIEVVWPGGKMVKEYTLLFDPPKVSLPPSQQLPKSSNSPTLETQVALKESFGAPGKVAQMVKQRAQTRRFARAHARIVRPGTRYGPVYDETLWSIAKKLVENTPYSVYQGVAAISSKNRQAFRTDNINSLAEGAVLDLPTIDELGSLNKNQAQHFVESQNNGWQHKNMYLAQAQNTVTSEKIPAPNVTPSKKHKPLKLVAPVAQSKENTANDSSQGEQSGRSQTPMSSRLSLIEEAIDTIKRSNEDIAQKNLRLQSQNETLMNLLSTKEAEINKLKEDTNQKPSANLTQDKTTEPNSSNESYAIARADSSSNTKEHGANTYPAPIFAPSHIEPLSKIGAQADNPAAQEQRKPTEPSGAEIHALKEHEAKEKSTPQDVKVHPKPIQNLVANDHKAQEPPSAPLTQMSEGKGKSYILKWMIFILALIALWFSRKILMALPKKFKEKFIQPSPVLSTNMNEPPEKEAGVQNQSSIEGEIAADPVRMEYGIHFDLDKSLNALSKQEKKYLKQENMSLLSSELIEEQSHENSNEYLRELEEAEVYIAYERYTQAENILQGILSTHPNKWEVLLKLLEVYVLTEKYDDFEKWYSTLPKDLREASPAIWSKIELLQEKVHSERGIALPHGNIRSSELSKESYIDLPAKSLAKDKPHSEELKHQNVNEMASKSQDKPFIDLGKKYALTLDDDMELDADSALLSPILTRTDQGLNDLLPEVSDDFKEDTREEATASEKKFKSKNYPSTTDYHEDNEILSQLSLAQAYIEIGDLEAAREILIQALANGSNDEKLKVQRLLDKLDKKN